MMGAGGQMPVLGQFAKGIVFDLPTQVSQIPDDCAAVPVQGSGHHPNPVLFLFLGFPLGPHPLLLRPAFPVWPNNSSVTFCIPFFWPCFKPFASLISRYALEKAAGLGHWTN